eukprot:1897227-Rhodomonas_salina.1
MRAGGVTSQEQDGRRARGLKGAREEQTCLYISCPFSSTTITPPFPPSSPPAAKSRHCTSTLRSWKRTS